MRYEESKNMRYEVWAGLNLLKWLKSEPLSGSVSHFIFILEKWLTFEPPYNLYPF